MWSDFNNNYSFTFSAFSDKLRQTQMQTLSPQLNATLRYFLK